MLIEWKPLADVPTIESLGETAKVIVVDGGAVKQTAASNIGGGGVTYSTLPAPLMTATIVCEDYADVSQIESFLFDDNNDEIYYTEMTSNTVTITGKICPYVVYDEQALEWSWGANVTSLNQQTQEQVPFAMAFSNCVNCVVDETQDGAVLITDPTLPCSCTITCTKSST